MESSLAMTPIAGFRSQRLIRGRPLRRVLPGAILLLALLTVAAGAWAGDGTVAVKARSFVTQYTAYAQVAPVTTLRLRAAVAGVAGGLDVVPGTTVKPGTTLARLAGPMIRASLAERQAAVAGAKAALTAAKSDLATQRQNLRLHLSTASTLANAEAVVAEAQARLDAAGAQLQTLQDEVNVQAPEAAQVLSVAAANGERVSPGQVLLTLQPAHDLWLKASFYGPDAAAIRQGMHGRFQPAGGAAAIQVQVRSVLGVMQSGGGLEVGCAPMTGSPAWHNGEAGTLELRGEHGTLPAVPTRALILDKGRWWVMLHTAKGERRQAVQLGPVQGDDTLIRQGLSPGAQVVVENPYLDFHRDFAQHYQQPD